MIINLTPSLAVKLGSLVTHVEEFFETDENQFDRAAILSLIGDPAVVEWLNEFEPGLLPVKRKTP